MSTSIIVVIGVAAGLLVLAAGMLFELSGKNRKTPPTLQQVSHGLTTPAIALLVAVFGLIIFGVVYVATFFMNIEPTEPVPTVTSAPALNVCADIGDTAHPADQPVVLRPYRVTVVDYDGTRHPWHNRLPDKIRAAGRETPDVVVCVTENREKIVEDCPYYDAAYSEDYYLFSIQRIAIYNDVFLVNPNTGTVFSVLRVWGTTPEYCPDATKGEPGTVEKRYGDPPEYEAFYTELAKAVE
jgi:hypothetical protein